ncbi:MAG: type II toxin-antitoxin system RelE/ParE family toxin [Gammaproteobacteria bacterium]|nr:type II toxin-antitoxin system RelE/ParE family toxin [Gammaproteobacteria bacterium]MBU1978167.1 type II toxin-antitoxin system RelE/ParE family toxin [Gammaproteobacteria bacterium]
MTMPYMLTIKQQARKKLQSLARPERFRLAEKIELLGANPDNAELDIKKLEGEPYYRMRVGNWRVIFDRQDTVRVISIEKIKPRGDAYK